MLKADWIDPEINPKLANYCRHYGMHAMPCRPWTPQHKGKIERRVRYAKGNALNGNHPFNDSCNRGMLTFALSTILSW